MGLTELLPFLPQFTMDSLINMELPLDFQFLSIHDKVDYSDSFPYLNDNATIEFIRNSKVMFIMRGLPGSGKSTLAKRLIDKYNAGPDQLCAGDLYFISKTTGDYEFDVKKLHAAHQWALNCAQDACRKSLSPVVIDNTNVLFWEIKPYIEIANQNGYLVILSEPRTEWKFDVNKLVQKTRHSVPRETIERRLHEFHPILPFYFGLFLNDEGSDRICDMALSFYNQLIFSSKSPSGLKEAHSSRNVAPLKHRKLHCTTKFCGRALHSPSVVNYLKKTFVALSIGRKFKLKIVAFTITNRTIGARIDFEGDSELNALWDNELEEERRCEIQAKLSKYTRNDRKVEFKRGTRAHLTISMAPGVHAVETGVDQLFIMSLIKLAVKPEAFVDFTKFELSHFGADIAYLSQIGRAHV